MKKHFPLVVILGLLIFQSCATSSFKQDIKTKTPIGFYDKVASIIVSKMNQYNIPGISIGLVKNDSIIYTKGYGVRNIETGNFVTENTVFHTASISKLFTAIAMMKLIDQTEITIDDKLVDILPELKYDDKRVQNITIKNLLNHTSGIPDIHNYHWGNNNQSKNSLKDFVLSIHNVDFVFPTKKGCVFCAPAWTPH